MKNSKQHFKLNNLQVKAQKCLSRKEAKKIIDKANKTQNKINNWNLICENLKIKLEIFFKTL